MTTFANVIDRTRRRLMSTQREPINVLATGIDNDDTNVTLVNQTRFVANSRLSIELEDLYVTDVSSGGLDATVIRGAYGSNPGVHSSGAIVQVNPSWSNWEIACAINDELHSLSSPENGLFQIKDWEFPFVPSVMGYDFHNADDMIDVWRVTYDDPGPEKDWKPIPLNMVRVDQNTNTTAFPSGKAIILKDGGSPGMTVRVAFRAVFTPLINFTDDVLNASGLHTEAHDILELGAAMRLAGGLEAQRALTTSQADPRRADEVPPGTAARAMTIFQQLRQSRIDDEKVRLARRYPRAST